MRILKSDLKQLVRKHLFEQDEDQENSETESKAEDKVSVSFEADTASHKFKIDVNSETGVDVSIVSEPNMTEKLFTVDSKGHKDEKHLSTILAAIVSHRGKKLERAEKENDSSAIQAATSAVDDVNKLIQTIKKVIGDISLRDHNRPRYLAMFRANSQYGGAGSKVSV